MFTLCSPGNEHAVLLLGLRKHFASPPLEEAWLFIAASCTTHGIRGDFFERSRDFPPVSNTHGILAQRESGLAEQGGIEKEKDRGREG